MAKSKTSRHTPTWRMRDTPAQFDRIVRLAREVGPQKVIRLGNDVVVVVAAEEFDRLVRSKRSSAAS